MAQRIARYVKIQSLFDLLSDVEETGIKCKGSRELLPQLLPMYTLFSQNIPDIHRDVYVDIILNTSSLSGCPADYTHSMCYTGRRLIILDAWTAHKQCFPGPNIMCKRVSGGPERVGGDCWLGCPADYTHSTYYYTARQNNIRCSDSA